MGFKFKPTLLKCDFIGLIPQLRILNENSYKSPTSVNQLKYMIDIYYYHMSCTYTWCSTLQSPTKEFVLL